MDLTAWAYANQSVLENLEVHLLHWQDWLQTQEPMMVKYTTSKLLQASISRHLDLSLHTLALLEQQRKLLAQLEAYTAKRLA